MNLWKIRRNRLGKWFLIYSFFILFSCDNQLSSTDSGYIYDVVIDYNRTHIEGLRIKERDSILFLFEKGFSDDKVAIESDGDIYENNFTTDPALDAAGYYLHPLEKAHTSLLLRINDGKSILLEIDSIQRIFTINHLNRNTDSAKVLVKSMVSAPVYQ